MPRSISAHKKISSPLVGYIAKSIFNSLLYVILLVSFLLNGYLFAKLQASGQSIFGLNPTPIAAGAATGAGSGNQAAVAAPENRENVDVGLGNLPVLGDKNAKVKIVEFSDFQCPFCRAFFVQTYAQLKKDYIDTGKVALYYRHFPLDFHPSSLISAEASECANEQGKFWQMHDQIYNEQEKRGSNTTITFTKDNLKTWAAGIGVDTATFNNCLDSEKYKDKVTKDITEGSKVGVTGTPTFFVNGTELVGAQPITAFQAAIEKQL